MDLLKSKKAYILIIVLSLFPLIDIFRTSFLPHTSDGAMHAVRFAAFYKEFIGGQFPVRWSSQFNYGYGSPIFNFFHPLPYIIGLPFLAVGVSPILMLKISFVMTYIFAGIFMLLYARLIFKDEKIAFLVAIMYQYAPFRLVEMLIRGSLGSLYCYAILPLVLYSLTLLIKRKEYKYFTLTTASTALLPLSHNIIGFVFFGLTVSYMLLLAKTIKNYIIGYSSMAFGLLLAAFFLIPGIIEHKYTNGYLFTKDLFYQHFAELYKFFIPNITNAHNLRTAELTVQIGFFHTIALFGILLLLIKKKLSGFSKNLAIYLLLVTTITFLFMQPITEFLWERISVLRQFQFPWRLMSVICFTSALSSAIFTQHFKVLQNMKFYCILLFLIIISTIYYWAPYQGYQNFPDSYFWNFPGSTNYFAEVNTIWMEHEPIKFPEKRVDVIAGKGQIENVKIQNEKHVITTNSDTSFTILDRTYFYPGWKVFIDTKPTTIQFQDQNYRGLITFNVPQGKHTVLVQYKENQLAKISNYISIGTILILIAGFLSPFNKIYKKYVQ